LRALISDLSWSDDARPSVSEGITQKQGVLARLKLIVVRFSQNWSSPQRIVVSKPARDNLLTHIGDPLRDYYKHVVDEPLPESLVAIVDRFDRKANARG
jgi:Anti-sigma factor NepR